MSSLLVTEGVTNAFSIMKQLGLVDTVTFFSTSERTYDMASGTITEPKDEVTVEGVIEVVKNEGGLVTNPIIKLILDKSTVNTDDDFSTSDFYRFDNFLVQKTQKTYLIKSLEDNFYSIEVLGVQV